MKTRASILAAALVLGAAAFTAGCTVYSDPAPTVEAEAYAPAYYDGNVVYYDEAGTPFVYVDHEVRYVPRSYAHFDVLVGHYRRHGGAYHAWYRTHHYREERRHYRR